MLRHAAGIVVGALVVSLPIVSGAQAAVYSIGNAQPSTIFFVQGQSFTPSVQGNDGSGTPTSVAGLVELTSFTIDFFDPTTAPGTLFIYASAPSVADASSGTGSLATGSYVGGGVYDFVTPVSLLFTTKYFAVLPTSESIFDGTGPGGTDLYTGGVDLFPQAGIVQGNGGHFDIGFNATFTAVPEPSTWAMMLAGFAGLGFAGYRATRKSGALPA